MLFMPFLFSIFNWTIILCDGNMKSTSFCSMQLKRKERKARKPFIFSTKLKFVEMGKVDVFFHLNSIIFLSFRGNWSASVEIVYQPWRDCCDLITIQIYWIAIDRFESFSMCFHWTFSHSHLQWNGKKRKFCINIFI